jgi:hypothetical protein
MNKKEFLYIGHYTDTDGNYMLKIGTTNDLDRRATEHTRNYRRAKVHTLPPDKKFEYNWHIPLSKYNTLRFEDKNRQRWIEQNIGEFVKNDRFCCKAKPKEVEVVIRKTYRVVL